MAKPWEKYSSVSTTPKPWEKYGGKKIGESSPFGDAAKRGYESAITSLGGEAATGQIKKLAIKNQPARQLAIGYGNQLAGGLPVPIANKFGMDIPEPQTGTERLMRTVGNIGGFISGAPMKIAKKVATKVIPRMVGSVGGKEAIKRIAGREGIIGGISGLLSTDATDVKGAMDLKDRGTRALYFGAGGATIPVIGRGVKTVATGTGRWISRRLGGITDATVNIIKRLGAKKVFDPVKADAEYLGKVIVPQIKERIVSGIEKGKTGIVRVLKKMGLPEEEVDILNSIAPSKRKVVADFLRGGSDDAAKFLDNQKQIASDVYEEARKSIPEGTFVDVKDAFYKLKNFMVKQGWMDKVGNTIEGSGVANKTRTNLIKIYNDMQRHLVTGKRVTGKISIEQMFSYLDDLDTTMTGDMKFDRIPIAISKSMRKASEVAAPVLKGANKVYADYKNMESLNKLFKKIGNEQVPFEVFLEQKLHQLGDTQKYNLRKIWQKIIGTNLFDDIEAHLANKDFEMVTTVPGTGGARSASRANILTNLIADASKQYYKNIKPAMQPSMGALSSMHPASLMHSFMQMRKGVSGR